MKEAHNIQDRTNKLLEASQSIAQVGGWELDLITKDLFWTSEIYRIHDTTPEEFNPTLDAGVDCYLPKSREILLEALKNATEDGEGYDLELELKTTKGRNIHVRTTCEVIIVDGIPVKLIGAFQDITERKLIEKQLLAAKEKAEESEQYLNNILNNIGDPIFVKDSQSRLKLVNDAFCDMFGMSRNDALGKTLAEHVPADEREHFLRVDNHVINSGEESIIEETLSLGTGESKTISTRKTRYVDNRSNKFLVGIIRDLTERAKTELKFRSINQILEDSQSLAHVGGWELDLVTDKVFWTAETYRIHDTTPEEFDPTTAHSGLAFYLPESREALVNAVNTAIASGQGYDLELELKTAKNRIIHVRTTGKVIYTDGKALKLLGAIQDITERKNNEEKLKANEESISAILNSLPSSVCVIDETGRIQQVNEAWNNFGSQGGHNRPADSFANYNYFDVCKADFEDEDAKSVYYGLQCLLADEIDEFEYEYPCHAPDKQQWFVMRANLMKSETKQIVISHIDISKRKELESAQKNLIEQSNMAFKAGKLGLWTLHLDSGQLVWNDQHLEIFGLSRDEFKGCVDDWEKQLHPDDANYAKDELAKALNGESFYGVEFRIFRTDGEIRYLEASGIPVYDDTIKLVKVVGINRDITAEKVAAQKLKNSEEKFSKAFDNSPNPTSIVNIKTGERLAVNKAFCETFGYSKSELSGGNIHFNNLMLDQSKLKELLEQVQKVGSLFQHPLNLLTKSGKVLNMLFNSTKLYPDNEDIHLVSLRDITEELRYEKKLKESDRVFNLAIDMFCIAGFDGYFKYLNPAWERTLGWSVDELLFQPWINFVYPEDQDKTQEVKSTIINGLEIFQFENRYVCKDGSVKWLSWNLQPFADEQIMVGATRDITEQKQQEEALIQSESRLKNAQKIAKLGSWHLDIKTNVVTWTEELYIMFGLDPAMPVPKWNEQQKNYTKESWNLLSLAVDKTSKDGIPYEIELSIIRQDKTIGWIMSRGEALRNESGEIYALSGIAQDITLRKHSERELRKLSTAVEQSPVSIVITDTNGVIEYANPKFSLVSGYLLEEVLGKNPKVLQSGYHDESFYKNMWETLTSGKTWTGEFLNKNKNGGLYWESASISPLKNSKGETTNFVAIKEDITVKKTLMKEHEVAKERAESANQLKDVFLANTSHEIRTPLNAIIGFSILLSDDLGEKDKEVYLDQIKSNSEQLLSLVNDLLNLTKLEGGNVALMNKPVDLNKLIRSIFAQHHQYIETHHKELELKLTVPQSEQNLIQVDEIKLKEILHNLIDNAVKFTKNGTIELGYTLTSKEIEFFVKDDGIGIPPNQQDAIFNRFTQVPGTSDKYGGTGLGLSICRGLVQVMGGKLWVESEINVGSTFLFTLPRISGDFIKATPPEKSNINPSGKSVNKVLVADDSASVRLFYKTILKKHKVDALISKSGQEAIDIYQQNIESIDLVLMDIRMPGMDGIEAMKRIKEINPDIMVIAQTAFAMDSEIERFRKEGFDDCLTKPIPEEELIRLLKG